MCVHHRGVCTQGGRDVASTVILFNHMYRVLDNSSGWLTFRGL